MYAGDGDLGASGGNIVLGAGLSDQANQGSILARCHTFTIGRRGTGHTMFNVSDTVFVSLCLF